MIEESTAFREAALVGRVSFLDQGPNPAKMYVFGGARASDIATLAAGAPLCIITLATPAGTVASGVLSLSQLEDGLILAGGLPTWCRVFNGDGLPCFDLDAGLEGSGSEAEAIFKATSLYPGGLLRLASCYLG